MWNRIRNILATVLAPDMSRRAALTRGLGVDLRSLGGGVQAAFDSGKMTRRDPDFTPQGFGPNAAAEIGNLDLVVRRCRDLADNNPLVDNAVISRVNLMIGTGIKWFPDTPWDDVNQRLEELHEIDVRRVDSEGCRSLWEDQRLCARELHVAGEVLAYYPVAEPFGKFGGGLAIELIARERIPLDVNGLWNGNEVRQGVEYDIKGRVVAYHVLTRHPRDGGTFGGFGRGWWGSGAYSLGSPNLNRVPADRCELIFTDRRIEQLRGVPRMVTVISTIRMEDGFQDDAMVGARLQTAYALAIPVPGNLSSYMAKRDQKILNGQEPAALDSNMRPIQRIEPGMIVFVKAGSEPKPIQPTLPGQQFPEVERVLQRRIAKGVGLDYATFSGDSGQSNFSSSRLDALNTRDDVDPDARMVWEHHTDPWRRGKIAEHVLTEKLQLTSEQMAEVRRHPEQLFRCRIGFKAQKYVNPAQEATANATDINAGVRSEIQAISEQGGDYRQVARELAKFESKVREERVKLGLPPERPKQGISGGAAPTSGGAGSDNGDGGGGNDNGNKPSGSQ